MNSPALKRLSFTFITLVIIIALVIAYFFASTATIIITPTIRPITHTFQLQIVPNIAEPNNDQITGNTWEEEITQEKPFAVLELLEQEEGFAKGEITIHNDRSTQQILVQKTRFLTTDNVLYYLDRQVTIPRNSSITASVTAAEQGVSGNLLPPARLSLPALSEPLQEQVYATVQKPIAGGIIKRGKLTESDVKRARTELLQDIYEQAQIDHLASFLSLSTSTEVVTPPENIIDTEVIDERANLEIGEVTDSFTYTIKTAIHGVSFDRTRLVAIAQSKFITALEGGETFISVDPDSLEYTLERINDSGAIALLDVSITGQSLITQSNNILDHSSLAGKNQAELIEYFDQFPGVQSIDVEFSPFWVSRVPRIKSKTTIIVKEIN